MRKTRLFLLLLVILVGTSSGAVAIPRIINYQGILRNFAGFPVADGSYTVTFRFYGGPAGGEKLWEENQIVTTKAGLFSALLGSINQIPDTVFAGDTYLGTTVGSDNELSPRTQISSVAYAFNAANADKVGGLGPDQLVYPSTPARVFRACAISNTSGTFPLFGPSGKIRLITGVWFQGFGTLRVDGTAILQGSGLWSSGNGAPIQIEPGEVVDAYFEASARSITVTGFEY